MPLKCVDADAIAIIPPFRLSQATRVAALTGHTAAITCVACEVSSFATTAVTITYTSDHVTLLIAA
eukprot:17573-Heterococcus_DN1.PRE.2